jgi:hypothetical protein
MLCLPGHAPGDGTRGSAGIRHAAGPVAGVPDPVQRSHLQAQGVAPSWIVLTSVADRRVTDYQHEDAQQPRCQAAAPQCHTSPVRVSTSYTAACLHLMFTAPTPWPAVQVGAREVPRSKTLPERPPVRLVTKVLPPVARKFAKPAGGGGAEAARTSGNTPPPPRQALQDLPPQPAGSPLSGDRSAGASCAAPARPMQLPAISQDAAAVEEGPAQQQPAAGSGLCAPQQQPDVPPPQQQQQQDVEMSDAVMADAQAAEPAEMAGAAAQPAPAAMAAEATATEAVAATLPPKTPAKSRLSQATTARHAPDFAEAGNAAIVAGAAPSAVTHEYIHGVLAKVR